MNTSIQNNNISLDSNEQLLWSGKPKFLRYLLDGVYIIPAFVLVLMLIMFLPGLISIISTNLISILISLAIILPGLLIPIIILLIHSIEYRNVRYYITDRRVIFERGLWGKSMKFVNHKDIKDISTTITILDKILDGNTGNIDIFTGQNNYSSNSGGYYPKFDTFIGINNPNEVLSLLKTSGFDSSTDVMFPNAYRPTTNPGYSTKYEPNESVKKLIDDLKNQNEQRN